MHPDAERSSIRRRQRMVGRLGLALGAMVISLGLCECTLQLYPGLLPTPVHVVAFARESNSMFTSPDLGKTYLPGQDRLRIHSDYTFRLSTIDLGYPGRGFRDDGIDGAPWAIAVGDSFTAGLGVEAEDSWPEVIEDTLGRDVVNLGVSGFSALQCERMLNRYGLPLGPEVVLLDVHPNDHAGNVEFLRDSQVRARATAAVAESHRAVAGRAPVRATGADRGWGASAWIAARSPREVLEPAWTWQADQEPMSAVLPEGDFSLSLTFQVGGPFPRTLFRNDQESLRLNLWLVTEELLWASARDASGTRLVSIQLDPDAGSTRQILLSVDLDHSLELHAQGANQPQTRPLLDPLSAATGPAITRGVMDVEEARLYEGALSWQDWERDRVPTSPERRSPRRTVLKDGKGLWNFGIDSKGRPTVLFRLGDQHQLAVAKTVLPEDRWFHLAFQVVDGEVQFFLDGERTGTVLLEHDFLWVPGGSLSIGGGRARFDGRLWRVRVHDAVVPPEQLRLLAREAADPAMVWSGPVAAYWSLEHIEEGYALDESGNGQAGLVEGVLAARGPAGRSAAEFLGTGRITVARAKAPPDRAGPSTRRRPLLLGELVKLLRKADPYGAVTVEKGDFLTVDRTGLSLLLARTKFAGPYFNPESIVNHAVEGQPLTFAAIERMAEACRSAGVTLVVVLSCSKEYVYYDEVAHQLAPRVRERAVPGLLWLRTQSFCEERGIPTIALGPSLRARASEEQLYFREDAHWTTEGNQIAAETVIAGLRDLGLVP